jgi:multicomponent Na+:H+ antiporter subunit D
VRTRAIPKLMVTATVGLVVGSVALTVFAGPIYEYGARAAEVLGDAGYVGAVLPQGEVGVGE